MMANNPAQKAEINSTRGAAPKFVKIENGGELAHNLRCGPLHSIKNTSGIIANIAKELAPKLEAAGFPKIAELMKELSICAGAVFTVSKDALSSSIAYDAGYPHARNLGKKGARILKQISGIGEGQFAGIEMVAMVARMAERLPGKYRERVLNCGTASVAIVRADAAGLARHYAQYYPQLRKFSVNGHNCTKGEVPPAVWATVAAESVGEVLENLISNAAKYGTEVHITVRLENGSLHISVRDNGCGVPAGFEGKLFDGSERLPNATWDSTHVGLPVSKRFAEEILGGSLEYAGPAFPGAEKPGAEFHLVVPDCQ